MPKFILIKDQDKTNPFDHNNVTFEVDAEYLPDVLENIETFLRAAGFVFEGYLDIVQEKPQWRDQPNLLTEEDFPEADQPFPSEVEEMRARRGGE